MLNGNNTGLAGHDALLAGIRTLIEQTPSALAVLDREARYVSVSKGWLQRFGRGAGAFVGTVAGAGGGSPLRLGRGDRGGFAGAGRKRYGSA